MSHNFNLFESIKSEFNSLEYQSSSKFNLSQH